MSKDTKVHTNLFHTMTTEKTFATLESSISGISTESAQKRLEQYGKNELAEGEKKTLIGMFFEQFKDVMVIILLVAAVIAAFMHEITDSFIILSVVIINAILGVAQESKAEKALAALKKMSSPYSKVRRNGEVISIKSEEVVPGDIVLLEAGDYVPADLRLIETASLKIEEAALTGESVPSDKSTEAIEKEDIVIGDRRNMAYLGSSVTYGRGVGIATGTGMNTEVGKIASYISKAEQEMTPLQKKLAELGKFLSVGILIIAAVIFAVGLLRGHELFEMFFIAVSLAVAAIPEGLPAIVTIVLALGVQRMAKRNAIVRKLPAVETLGSTEIICSDKTGTLTLNRMTVKEIFVSNELTKSDSPNKNYDFDLFTNIMVLCNDCKVSKTEDGKLNVIGDPTEVALINFGNDNEYYKNNLESSFPRKNELPFDSDRKLMTTINDFNGELKALTKGATDVLLERCSRILINGNIENITEELIQKIKAANTSMASKALRVLGVAFRTLPEMPSSLVSEELENDMVFVGLIGMIDPPRQEVKDAVKVCRKAGIRPIMITGDHRDTAVAIAKELEIITDESEAITGRDLDKISDEEFLEAVKKYSVYARVSPEHKVRIVEAWRKNDKVVAMTGDGVNDAPALKKSDIGVGMGITGTDVAKGVSDMVLADDNFATIVSAVEEGRKIYSNIRKSIQFLLSSNLGEIVTLFLATMLNWTVLLPIHILWVNLVTDTFPALALGVEKSQKDIMNHKPRHSKDSFFSHGMGINIIYQGILKGLITLTAFYIGLVNYGQSVAITMAFATLGLVQLTHSLNARSNRRSLLGLGLFSNMYLIGAILVSGLLQVIVIVVPTLNKIFKVEHLNLEQWGIVTIAAIAIIPIVEIVKFVQIKVLKKDYE